MSEPVDSIRSRSEGAIGELAQALIDNPLFGQALGGALGLGERAIQAQRGAMHALDVPSAESIEQLAKRIRSLSERMESIEDSLDGIRGDLRAIRKALDADAAGGAAATGKG